ncbi:MAG TPA: hypothetical protein VK901_11340, partial [Nitrospiraceae bacterium]|nr:hypothetical protein [Nitrospiraceae bacterium]
MNKLGFSLCGLAAALLLIWLANRSAFFPMRYPDGDWARRESLGAEDVWITTSDGVRIHAWWRPQPEARAVT